MRFYKEERTTGFVTDGYPFIMPPDHPEQARIKAGEPPVHSTECLNKCCKSKEAK